MTDKHTKDAKDSKDHESHSHKHTSHDTKHHDHSDHKSESHAKHGSHDSKEHKHSDHGSHAKHETKSEPKVSHVSRSEPAPASQGSSPWLVVSIVLGVLFLGSLATGGYSDLPDWNPGFDTGDQRSSDEFNLDGAYAKGDESAEVTIIEYSDFECPFCARFYSDTLPQIEENYIETGKVKLVYKHFPLSIHPNADNAAEAAECAGDQGAFYDMHDVLFDRQSAWARDSDPTDTFVGYAEELGLNANEFRSCLESGEHAEDVEADFQEGSQAGVRGTPAFFINGRMISGAQPYSVFREAIEAALSGEAPAPEPTPSEPSAPSRVEFTAEGPVKGEADAPLTLVEFTDYQCPFCKRHFDQTYDQIVENYVDTGDVKIVMKDFPLSIHPTADEAAVAARCAGQQDAYYEMHDTLFEEQSSWANGDAQGLFVSYAEDLNLDTAAFEACLEDPDVAAEVQADFSLGQQVGVSGTPSFFIGTEETGFVNLVGAQPYSAFEQAIDQELAALE